MIIHSNLSKMKNKILPPVYKETLERVSENSSYGVLGAERVKSPSNSPDHQRNEGISSLLRLTHAGNGVYSFTACHNDAVYSFTCSLSQRNSNPNTDANAMTFYTKGGNDENKFNLQLHGA